MKTSKHAKCSVPVFFPGSKRSLLKLSNNIYTNIYFFSFINFFFRERMAALVLGVIKESEDKRFVDTVAAARVV